MADGDTVSHEVVLALGDLNLSDLSSESQLAGIVADIYCRADAARHDPFDLIIEVAVTHRVDEDKSKKIKAMDIACLEIDVRGFRQSGRITVAELAHEVLRNPQNKRWIHHPLMAQKIAGEHLALDEQEKARRDAIEQQRRTRGWLNSMTQEQLLGIYLQALVHYWKWGGDSAVAGHFVELSDLSSRLVSMGLAGAAESPIAEKGGVLHFLHLCKTYSHAPVPANISLTEMCSTLAQSRYFRSLITYCLVGIKVYKPLLRGAQGPEMQAIRTHILNSLQRGESHFARLRKFDALIGALFPELRSSLAAEFGTEDHARALQLEKRKRESERNEKEQASRAALERAMKHEQNRNAVTQAIFEATRCGWLPKLGLASDVEQILATREMRVAAKRFMAHGFDVQEVISSAWSARESGTTAYAWFRTRYFSDASEVHKLKDLLKLGWML